MYDIILMDVHMPIIDGLEASRRIRDTYPPEERPKIVALSADTTQVRAQQCCSFVFLSWWSRIQLMCRADFVAFLSSVYELCQPTAVL